MKQNQKFREVRWSQKKKKKSIRITQTGVTYIISPRFLQMIIQRTLAKPLYDVKIPGLSYPRTVLLIVSMDTTDTIRI